MASDERILDVIGLLVVLGIVAGIGILVLFGAGGGPADPAPSPPNATWTAARVNATHVQLAHAGGDPVRSDDLVVTVGNEERPTPWSGRVTQGDVGLVRAETNRTVALYWTGGRTDGRVRLGSWKP